MKPLPSPQGAPYPRPVVEGFANVASPFMQWKIFNNSVTFIYTTGKRRLVVSEGCFALGGQFFEEFLTIRAIAQGIEIGFSLERLKL